MRRQCRRFEFQRILLPVRMRIHWGMGRFWAIFFASVRFVRKVLCDGCGGEGAAGERFARGVAFSLELCCVLRAAQADVSLGGVGQSAGPALRSFAALFFRCR